MRTRARRCPWHPTPSRAAVDTCTCTSTGALSRSRAQASSAASVDGRSWSWGPYQEDTTRAAGLGGGPW
eukprot:10685400-Alexandrium_andersonii.AAC.1